MMNFGADQAILFVLLTVVYFNLSAMLPFIVKSFCLTDCKSLDFFFCSIAKVSWAL